MMTNKNQKRKNTRTTKNQKIWKDKRKKKRKSRKYLPSKQKRLIFLDKSRGKKYVLIFTKKKKKTISRVLLTKILVFFCSFFCDLSFSSLLSLSPSLSFCFLFHKKKKKMAFGFLFMFFMYQPLVLSLLRNCLFFFIAPLSLSFTFVPFFKTIYECVNFKKS